MRVIDSLHTVVHQFLDFLLGNGATSAAEYLDMSGIIFIKTIDHVAEEFVMPTLVGADRDTVSIFLDRSAHDVVNATVMSEMNDFSTLRLDQAPHDIDRGIVTIKQRSGGHKA